MVKGMAAKNVILVVLLLQHIAVALQLLAYRKIGNPRADFAKRVQRQAGCVILGAVIAGNRHHFPAAVIRRGDTRFRHHAGKLRVKETDMGQGYLSGHNVGRRIMQGQFHTAQGKIRRFQAFPGTQLFYHSLIPFFSGKNLRHVFPHAFLQKVPRLTVLCKQIRQKQAFSRG